MAWYPRTTARQTRRLIRSWFVQVRRRPAAAIGSSTWAFLAWAKLRTDLAALKGVLDMMRADDVQTARAVGLRQGPTFGDRARARARHQHTDDGGRVTRRAGWQQEGQAGVARDRCTRARHAERDL